MAEATAQTKRTDRRGRRAVVLSLGFPVIGWFFGSRIGLIVAVLAVALWWTVARPERLLWPAAVGMLALAPFAVWAQGLPQTSVVGADFGVRHWIANDLVTSALVVASFAALTELLHLDTAGGGRHGIRLQSAGRPGQRADQSNGGSLEPGGGVARPASSSLPPAG
jgi:hypothetical protein